MRPLSNHRGWVSPAALVGLAGALTALLALAARPRPEAAAPLAGAPIQLGWVSNIARNQGADSLDILLSREAPGANLVVLGTGGFFLVRSTTRPGLNHFSMDSTWSTGSDPNINQFTFLRSLEGARRAGARVIVSLPFEDEIRRKLAGESAYQGPYSPLDSLERCVRFVLEHVGPAELAGWYVGDEPNQGVGYPGDPSRSARYSHGVLDSMAARIRRVDPDARRHPILPILMGTPERSFSESEIRQFYLGKVANAFMVDGYLGGNRPDFTANRLAQSARLEVLARQVAPAMARAGALWYAVLQGWNISAPYCNFDRWYRCGSSLPESGSGGGPGTPVLAGGAEVDSVGSGFEFARAQLRYQALSALAGGARGVLFFGGFPRDSVTQTGPPYATAGFRRRAVAPVLRLLAASPLPGMSLPEVLGRGMDRTSDLETASPSALHFRMCSAPGDPEVLYVVASNDGGTALELAWNTSRVESGVGMSEFRESQMPTGDSLTLRALPGSRGNFSDRIGAHEGRIYVIAPASRLPRGGASGDLQPSPLDPAPQVSPNPFRGNARILFAAIPGPATLQIMDVAGRLVRSWTAQVGASGTGESSWDGRSEAGSERAGFFFCRIRTAAGVQTVKLLRMN